MPKLRLYCKFKEDKQEELYLSLPTPMRLRRDLARFRATSHKLEVEMGRHNDNDNDNDNDKQFIFRHVCPYNIKRDIHYVQC